MSPPRSPARPLSRRAGELLAARAALESGSISRRPDRTRALLLPAQQRIWLHDQIEGGAGYVRPVALRIEGPLDVRALEQALATIVTRHETLHARLDAGTDGMPLLRIVSAVAPVLTIHDLRTALPEPGTRLVDPQLLAEVYRPFDLPAEAPVRASLFRHGPEAHLLLTVFHHIAFDGWSVAVYLRELSAAYGAALTGAGDGLGELVLQCGDIAESALIARALPGDLDYWRDSVRGVESALALPLDHPRRPGQPRDANRAALELPPALVKQLRELSRHEGVSLFMTFAAAFQVLLSRYSGQEDFLIGIPTAGRTRPEMDGLIGCFINTLALRCDLTGSPTFRELLQRVRRNASGAMAHQTVPFEQVLRLLGGSADRELPAGAQVLLNFRNLPPAAPHLDGLKVGLVEVPPPVTLFDLELDLTDTGSAIGGSLVYPVALFDEATAERLVAHLRALLEAAIGDPGSAASRMPILSEAERRVLLGAPGAGAAPAVPWVCVHQRIAERAMATPDATAISGPAGELTYAVLMARAQSVARTLQETGVRRGDRVGLAVERSPNLIVGMLGVMFAGAAYVPLDPEYPDARLAFIVTDASLRCILTDRTSEHRLAGLTEAPVITVDGIAPLTPGAPVSAGPATPEDAAYVIYTSGSTGTPKGVVIGHRALAAFTAAATEGFGITGRDRFLQFSTPNFDASVVEIFPTLAAGATLVLRDAAMAQSVDGFVAGCERWGVTVAVPATAFWHEVVRALADAGKTLPSSIRLMAPGGERMLPERAAQWRRVAPQATLFNAYGPTETTVHVTRYQVPADFDAAGGAVPIGAPNPNVRACVLDRWGDLAPRGAPGELHIGGVQLADGYLNRPELTAERFVASPFSEGERLYRTGDLVRWRNDGQLEYLGRLDRQVKVRGFRVEIGEIESALLASDAVLECAVETRESDAGDQRLIAYIVPAAESLDIEALGDHLRRRLPAYMIPALVSLATIPRTPNGKLDRDSLPEPARRAAGVGAGHVGPRSPLEFQLVQLWERLLDVRPVGVRDDFFALGGHSLLAVRMTAELERTCGLKLPLSTLFHATTIEQVAAELVRAAAPAGDGSPVLLNAGGTRPPLVFLHGDVLGGGLYCREVAKLLGPDQPMYVIGPAGPGDPPTIEAMADAELEWIRRIAGGRYRLAGFCNGGLVAYEIARQLERTGERTELLFLIDVPARNVGLGGLERVLKWAAGSAHSSEALAQRAARMRRVADLLGRARTAWAKGWNHRLRVAARKAHSLLLPERSPEWMGERAAPSAAATMLAFVSRAVNAYVPRRYGGPVHVVSARTDLREARRWARPAPSLTVHNASVDHQAVVTVYVPGALRTCLAALDGTEDIPSASSHQDRA